jgi:hypothetical protein
MRGGGGRMAGGVQDRRSQGGLTQRDTLGWGEGGGEECPPIGGEEGEGGTGEGVYEERDT